MRPDNFLLQMFSYHDSLGNFFSVSPVVTVDPVAITALILLKVPIIAISCGYFLRNGLFKFVKIAVREN